MSTGEVGVLGVLGLSAVGVATLGWPAGDWLDRTLVAVNVAMAVTAVAFGVVTWRNGRPAATRR